MQILPLIIEVDNTEVTRLINNSEKGRFLSRGDEGFLVEEIKNLMYTCGSIKICFQPLECKKVDNDPACFILIENEAMFN